MKTKRAAKFTSCKATRIKMVNENRVGLSVGFEAYNNCNPYGFVGLKHVKQLLVDLHGLRWKHWKLILST